MSSILILLALLSLATLASRRGGFAALLASSLPAFAVGMIAGPHVLAYLSVNALHGLAPATATGICWLGLVLGHRASRFSPLRPRALARGVFVVVVGSALLAAVVTAADRAWALSLSLPVRIAIGLLGATILLPFSVADEDDGDSRALDLVVIVAVVTAIGVLTGPSVLVATLGTIVVGALAGVSALLVGGDDDNRRFPALLAATALITALAWAVDVHIGIAGVGVGLGVGLFDRRRRLDRLLEATGGPVALVVAFLVGATLPLSGQGAGLGIASAVVAILVIVASSTDDDPHTSHIDTAVRRAATSSTGLLILGGLLLEVGALAAVGDVAGTGLGIALGVIDAVVVMVVLIKKGASVRRSKA